MSQVQINNEGTKEQIRRWLENAVKNAKNPDPRIILRKKREERRKKVYKNYGL